LEAWKIHKDRAACEKPGCPLATAEEFFAVLELPDCMRKDLCGACFQSLPQEGKHAPIYWKARRREPGRKAPTLDLVSLRVLFERLGEVEGERAQGLRYFVCLLLLRKRMLKLVDPQNDEEERADLVVIDPKAEVSVRVSLFAPEVDEERLANLKDELLAAIDETDAGEPADETANA
jgi:hypothetical protein